MEEEMTEEEIKKLKRRIIDYLHKYSSLDQLIIIAKILGIKILG
jgi:hypothetical protein